MSGDFVRKDMIDGIVVGGRRFISYVSPGESHLLSSVYLIDEERFRRYGIDTNIDGISGLAHFISGGGLEFQTTDVLTGHIEISEEEASILRQNGYPLMQAETAETIRNEVIILNGILEVWDYDTERSMRPTYKIGE